mmetsp:Transcript_12966/g.16830  ORF Transcript_12966/g.16830 Transcript_12966/m.16830 type:complete len:226 (+) Transcript_12966:1033-1710(+)
MAELCFVFLASLNISLVWLELSNKINRMSTNTASSKKYQRIVYAFQFGFVAIALVGVTLGFFYISAIIGLPYIIFLLYIYKRGHDEFSSVLKNALVASDNNQYLRLARLVRVTAITVSTCMIVYFVSACIFAALIGIDWQEYSKRGGVSLVVVFLQLTHLVATGWMAALFWYAHINMTTLKKSMSTAAASNKAKSAGSKSPAIAANASLNVNDTVAISEHNSHSI